MPPLIYVPCVIFILSTCRRPSLTFLLLKCRLHHLRICWIKGSPRRTRDRLAERRPRPPTAPPEEPTESETGSGTGTGRGTGIEIGTGTGTETGPKGGTKTKRRKNTREGPDPGHCRGRRANTPFPVPTRDPAGPGKTLDSGRSRFGFVAASGYTSCSVQCSWFSTTAAGAL